MSRPGKSFYDLCHIRSMLPAPWTIPSYMLPVICTCSLVHAPCSMDHTVINAPWSMLPAPWTIPSYMLLDPCSLRHGPYRHTCPLIHAPCSMDHVLPALYDPCLVLHAPLPPRRAPLASQYSTEPASPDGVTSRPQLLPSIQVGIQGHTGAYRGIQECMQVITIYSPSIEPTANSSIYLPNGNIVCMALVYFHFFLITI